MEGYAGKKISGNVTRCRSENPQCRASATRCGGSPAVVTIRLLSFKIGDFHRSQNETEEYNRVWLRKCGQITPNPNTGKDPVIHVEADKSASNTRPAS